MLVQTGLIQASRRVTRRLAWDPTCLLLSPSFPIKNEQNFKVLNAYDNINLILENYPVFKGLKGFCSRFFTACKCIIVQSLVLRTLSLQTSGDDHCHTVNIQQSTDKEQTCYCIFWTSFWLLNAAPIGAFCSTIMLQKSTCLYISVIHLHVYKLSGFQRFYCNIMICICRCPCNELDIIYGVTLWWTEIQNIWTTLPSPNDLRSINNHERTGKYTK